MRGARATVPPGGLCLLWGAGACLMSTGWGSGIMAGIRRSPELKCDRQELGMGGEGEGK
jgi:hypothetical protein